MTAIFDTHTFLWWDGDRTRLSPTVLAVCQNPANQLLVSIVSVWEIAIKARLGKLTLRESLPTIISDQQKQGIQLLTVREAHIYALESLPMLHKDPFDRLIIAQTQVEKLTLLTVDATVATYPVLTLW